MIEVGARDSVLAARAEGLRAGRACSQPTSCGGRRSRVLSMAGPLLGQLMLGLFVVEWIFAIPGIGRYFIAAAQTRDYPLTLGLTVVLTTCVLAVNAASGHRAGRDPWTRAA